MAFTNHADTAQRPRAVLNGTKAKVAAVSLATALALSVGVNGAWADTTLTDTKSVTVSNVLAEAVLHYSNCPYSTAVCEGYVTNEGGNGQQYNLTLGGFQLPAGAVITSATLSWVLPYVNGTGAGDVSDFGSVAPGDARPPSVTSIATLYGAPSKVFVGNDIYSFGLFPGVSLDLLAQGFGADLMAGDALTFDGFIETDRVGWSLSGGLCIGCQPGEELPPNPGYNSDDTIYLSVGFEPVPVTATLDITYAEAANAVPEPAMWAMMLTGFAAVGARLRRRQGHGGQSRSLPAGG